MSFAQHTPLNYSRSESTPRAFSKNHCDSLRKILRLSA